MNAAWHEFHLNHLNHSKRLEQLVVLRQRAAAVPTPTARPVSSPPSTDRDGDYDHDTSDQNANAPVSYTPVYGNYSCSQLESLWDRAGGNPAAAFIAAEIAMAESGGNPNAISPSDDFGLWQINISHGPLATLDPMGNARAAIAISGDGSNWEQWTTYTGGLYIGRC